MLWESPTFEEMQPADFRRARRSAQAAEYRAEKRKTDPEYFRRIGRRCDAKPETKARRQTWWAQLDPETRARYNQNWKDKVQHRRRWLHIEYTYGLTPLDFTRLLVRQDIACAICRKMFTSIHGNSNSSVFVDHDHAIGKVRGLLCTKCNTGVGHLESPGWLDAALAYLARHKK